MVSAPRPANLRPHRAALAGLLVGCSLLIGPAVALADTVSIAVSTPAGASDPAAFLPRTFVVSGTSSSAKYLYVKHHAAGGAPCAASPYLDAGALWTGFYGLAVNGSFRFESPITWDAAGTWVFCFWLGSDQHAVAAPTSQAVTFRWPTATMSASVSPAVPRPDEWLRVTVTGWSEAPRLLYVKVRPAGTGPCAQTYDADPGQSVIGGESANGVFTGRADAAADAEGRYVICSWLAGSPSDPSPIGGPHAQLFDVVQPPPVVATAVPVDCETHTYVRRFQARRVSSVCMRYRFSMPPATGARVAVTYVTPQGHRYRTVTWSWPNALAQKGTSGPLPARAFRNRPGTWQAVLRVAGRKVATTTFRVAP